MSNSTATLYSKELATWIHWLLQFQGELNTMQHQLIAIIQLDSIPERAQKADDYLNQIDSFQKGLLKLLQEIEQQDLHLKKNDTLLDDKFITRQINKNQEALRERMTVFSDPFLEFREGCLSFITENLK